MHRNVLAALLGVLLLRTLTIRPTSAQVLYGYRGRPARRGGSRRRDRDGLDTIVRGVEGARSFNGGGFQIESGPGSTGRRASMSLAAQERGHMRNFLQCKRTREKPNCDIELACRVRISLIMAMMSFAESKVAHFDAATETIRMS
jgi:hypothetical protein